MSDPRSPLQKLVLVTGPSGAGRSTAINALEDIGFETIDNIPLSLIPRLLDAPDKASRPMALGVDVRNRDFSAHGLIALNDEIAARGDVDLNLLYLDCRADVLARRFSETRRRHPLAQDDSPDEGIARELAMLEDVRNRADIRIETSDFTVHDLRAELQNWFARADARHMALTIQSFSFKRGLPQSMDTVFDVRFLKNPHWDAELRPLTGLSEQVVRYVRSDPRFDEFLERVTGYLLFTLPAYLAEGKTHFSVGVGCTGGQHRSVALTEIISQALADHGWQVSTRHRELERLGGLPMSRRSPGTAKRLAQ